MEQIDVELSEFTMRSRSMAVSHVAHEVARFLEPGEHVVLRDLRTGHYFTAAVADVDFELEDTVYRVEVGARISAEEAGAWLVEAPADEEEHVSTQRILELLVELRRSRRQVRRLLGSTAH